MSGGSSTTRMDRAKNELRRSLRALPDFAKFLIVFYNDGLVIPPDLDTWKTARTTTVRKFNRWLEKLEPDGGTEPLPAFQRVLSESSPPDVIFFLTDGAISSMTAEEVDMLNRRGLKTVINTIAFGDDSSQERLKKIAEDSGGVYRYVSGGGGP